MNTSLSFGQEAQGGQVQANAYKKGLMCQEYRAVPRKAAAEDLGTKRESESIPKPGPRRGALTCAHVDSKGYYHGGRHHPAPRLHLGPLHAVEDGHTAHVALSG